MKLPAFLRRPPPGAGGRPRAEIVYLGARRRTEQPECPQGTFSPSEDQVGIDHVPDHVAALRQLT